MGLAFSSEGPDRSCTTNPGSSEVGANQTTQYTIMKNLEPITEIIIKALEIDPEDRTYVEDILLNQSPKHVELSLGMLSSMSYNANFKTKPLS